MTFFFIFNFTIFLGLYSGFVNEFETLRRFLDMLSILFDSNILMVKQEPLTTPVFLAVVVVAAALAYVCIYIVEECVGAAQKPNKEKEKKDSKPKASLYETEGYLSFDLLISYWYFIFLSFNCSVEQIEILSIFVPGSFLDRLCELFKYTPVFFISRGEEAMYFCIAVGCAIVTGIILTCIDLVLDNKKEKADKEKEGKEKKDSKPKVAFGKIEDSGLFALLSIPFYFTFLTSTITYSPLEQFEILPLIPFYNIFLDFSITNETIILFIIFFLITTFIHSSFKQSDFTLFIIPNRWQTFIEIIYKMVLSMILDNINTKSGQNFFPIVFSIFFFIVLVNIIGLFPYSFTLTSHLIVTFCLSLSLFLGINIICIRLHGLEFFSLFFPSGTSVILALLLVPIELISYVFKPISLSIRLFANMMAGHTLLKVIGGFAWSLMSFTGFLFLIHYVPLLILIPLFGLEFGVGLIQAFVFSVLICIYLNDAINLH